MKLHLSKTDGLYTFSAYGDGWIEINGRRFDENVAVLPTRIVPGWTAGDFDSLVADDFASLAGLPVEILLLGTGPRIRFPRPELIRALIEARIGVEVMDTPAACRTYNLLAAEGRKVGAALLIR